MIDPSIKRREIFDSGDKGKILKEFISWVLPHCRFTIMEIQELFDLRRTEAIKLVEMISKEYGVQLNIKPD